MGKTRWERGAQALLETLTAAEGLGSSAIRPLKEVRAKEERNREGKRDDAGGNSRRHGKLPDERSESYEIWPPCGGARLCSALLVWLAFCAQKERVLKGGRGERRRRREREREKEKDLFYSRIKIPIRTLSFAL